MAFECGEHSNYYSLGLIISLLIFTAYPLMLPCFFSTQLTLSIKNLHFALSNAIFSEYLSEFLISV